jgi:hypothetical protein
MGLDRLRLVHTLFLALLFLVWTGPARADSPWVKAGPQGQPQVQLYFFWSLKCPHCLEARPHIEALANQHDWLSLHSLELSRHPNNVELYLTMAQSLGQRAEAVPALIFCGEMHVGWESPEATGAYLSQRLTACRDRVAAGHPARTAQHVAQPGIPLIGSMDLESLSLPMLTLVLASMDAFNPCAFFVLLFLLSLMVHQQRRSRMLLIGGIFVFFSGLMYFAFMAAWLNLFKLMAGLAWVTATAGGLAVLMGLVNVKDFFAFKQGLSLSIPESRKADIFRRGRAILVAGSLPTMLAATVALAVAANFYELLCTAGFPMVYSRLLTLHELQTGTHYLYLALYNLIYIVPLLVIVLAFALSMGRHKLSERQGRLLKLLSGLMMLGLGTLLLLAPERLSSLGIALALVASALLLTWIAARLTRD